MNWRPSGSEPNSTALFVTHQISEAILLGDLVIVLSARPGRVREVIPVDLPRPRTIETKRGALFNQLEEHVWDLIGQEADKMRRQDLPAGASG